MPAPGVDPSEGAEPGVEPLPVLGFFYLGAGGREPPLAGGAGHDERGGGGNRLMHHVDLLEQELVADRGEGGERLGATKMDADVAVLLIETREQVEDQCATAGNTR